MSLGLKRGTVQLEPHDKQWDEAAIQTIRKLKSILGDDAIDIQHIGSTAIPAIKAKPVIDIVVGVTDFERIMLHNEQLQKEGIFYRGSDVEYQILYVMGDMEKDIRTHHIHVVKWNGTEWKNYIHFRDCLNANENIALQYERVKEELESKFQNKGIASNVIKQLFDIYPNTIEWWLSTIKQEEKNCHLYEKCGFVRTGDEIVVNENMTLVFFVKSYIEVRRFKEEDAKEVRNLIVRNFLEVNSKDYGISAMEKLAKVYDVEKVLDVASYAHMYVFEFDGKIIGTGSISSFWGSETESILLSIFVIPEFHGKGVGRKIINTLETDEFYVRASRIEIPASITATEFYRKFGYDYKNGVKEFDNEHHYRLEKFKEAGLK